MENEKHEIFSTQIEAPEEGDVIKNKLVRLNRTWVFWENYEGKSPSVKLEWEKSIKKIFEFNDIISFWQFVNNYLGSELSKIFFNGQSIKYFFPEKNRIVGLNLFERGISPKWEDPKNANGTVLTLNYEVKDRDDISIFLTLINKNWSKLMLIIVGEGLNINISEYINGIRLIDKSQIGKKTLFRIEIWIREGFDLNELDILKTFLKDNFGSIVNESKIKVD